MKNIARIAFAMAMMVALPATTWASSYYGKLVVTSADSAAGKVYASDSSETPAAEDFKDTSEKTKASDATRESSANVTLYAHALAEGGNTFEGWYSDEGLMTKESDANPYAVTIKATSTKESSPTTKQLYAKFIQHTHSFAYSISGDTITKTCTVAGCTYEGGVAGTATLTANDATYTGKAYAAASIVKTGDIAAELSYSTETAPIDAGTYSVTMKVDGGEAENSTLTKQFTIKPAEITALTLEPTSFNYDGTEKSTSIKSVKADSLTLTESDYDISGDAMTQIGSLYETEPYTVTVTGKGNYTGTASATWTIKAPTGEFDDDALSTSAPGCTADGNTVTVTDSTALAYNPETLKYSAAMTVTWPAPKTTSYTLRDYGTATYIDAPHAFVTAPNDATYSGSQVLDVAIETPGLSAETAEGQYAYSLGNTKKFTYFKSLTFTAEFTAEEVAQAVKDGKTSFDYSMTAWSIAWKGGDNNTCGSDTGLKPTTYTLTIPLEGIVLNDENGNQVYPHVDFVAEIGLKKFATLGAALDVVEEGETVTLIADAEADDFAVPAGATLDLVGFGNAAATYVIDAIEDKSATIKSVKEETVTAVIGYRVVTDTTTEPGVYIYTAVLDHQHSWTFEVEEDGITLTATCGNPDCTIDGASLQLQLQGVEDKDYDGSGISPEVVDIEKEGYKFREVIEGVEVGEITYERPEYSAGKWYTGAYTASCVVTIDETPYTLEKDFEILPTDYTSGYVVSIDGLSVRFDSFDEAMKAANDGDTIYYKGGNLTGKEVTLSSSKNITLDLGGKSLKHDAYETVTLKNSGEGTVTLTNGTIVQPKAGGALGSAGQMTIQGNFAFADIKALNRATSGGNFLTFTVKSGTVTILDGKYTAGFKADGGEVVFQGGQFWDGKYESWGSDRYQFTKPTPAEGYIVIPGEEKMDDGNGDSRDLVWKIVAHTHEIVYSAAGNVITATCDAEDHEYCGYGEETLTLTAEDREATGEQYDGASIEYSENFPVKEAEIVYFDGDQELPGAPTEVGEEYIAKVTVEDATAEAPFKITHNHQFSYDALDAMTIGVKCTTEIGTCEFHDWKRATLTAADTKTYDGTPYAASFELEEGFPTDYVTVSLEYWVKNGEELEDAPSAVGDYTVKMVTSEDDTPKYTLEKDFDITPADLAIATITLSETSFNFDGYEKSVTISSVKFGEMTLTEGVDYEISEESVLTAAGEGRVDETFTVKIEGIEGGNFAGEGSTTWTIVAGKERDDFKFGAGTASGEYGEVVDKTLTVTDSTKLVYEGEGTWSMAMNVVVPIDGKTGEHFVPTSKLYFRNPQTDEIVIGNNAEACGAIGVVVSDRIASGDYRAVTSFAWTEKVSLEEIEDAILAGEDSIVRTLKVWSPKWSDTVLLVINIDNHNGLPVTEYKMELPLADLVLPVSADTELRMEGTMFANDAEFDAYELLLGKGAKVYGDPNYEDEEGYFGYLPNEDLLKTDVEGYNVGCDDSDESNIFYTTVAKKYNLAYEFVDEDGAPLDGVTNPYKDKKTYTIEDEIIFSEAATLEGYEFIEWSPAKIEKGTTGKQTITGIFKLLTILPTANVEEKTAEGYEAAVEFTAGKIGIGYDDWTAEFILTSDVAIGADEIKLGGQYDAYSANWIDIDFPGCEAGESISVLGLVGYNDITVKTVFDVIKSFKCGVKNIALKNDATFTLKLVITDGETTKEICSIDGLTVEKKAIDPVVPGEDIIIPEGKDAHEYAAEIEAKKATLLKAPITLEGDELATYQSYFTAQVVDVTVQFVLNDEGEAAVEAASEAAKREALAVALSADETTFTPSAPLKGFYHSLKQGGDFLALAFNVEGDKNKIGDDISFELVKPSDKGFYRLIITPTPYKE